MTISNLTSYVLKDVSLNFWTTAVFELILLIWKKLLFIDISKTGMQCIVVVVIQSNMSDNCIVLGINGIWMGEDCGDFLVCL